VFYARVEKISGTGFLCRTDLLAQAALPSVMRKCVALAASG